MNSSTFIKGIFTFLFALALLSSGGIAQAEVTPEDAAYAQGIGAATQKFTAAVGDWGIVYQSAPSNFKSAKYKSWMKKAISSDNQVKAALTEFSKIKVSAGYESSDKSMREFIKSYRAAITLYAPAIKKNDAKLMKKANDAILKATSLFTKWSNEFASDSAALTQ
jgi:hypothetical protein